MERRERNSRLSAGKLNGKEPFLEFLVEATQLCWASGWGSDICASVGQNASQVRSPARPAGGCKVEAGMARGRLPGAASGYCAKCGIMDRVFAILFNESRHRSESLATQPKWAISYQGKIVFAAFGRWSKYFTKQFYIPKTFVCLGNAGCFTLRYLLQRHNFPSRRRQSWHFWFLNSPLTIKHGALTQPEALSRCGESFTACWETVALFLGPLSIFLLPKEGVLLTLLAERIERKPHCPPGAARAHAASASTVGSTSCGAAHPLVSV